MHAIDVRNLCTSLVLLVINKVNVRSLEKEEKNPVNWRQPWKHLTHILPFLSPSLFTNSPLYPTPLPLSTEEVCHIRKHQFSREIIFFHPPPPRHQCTRTSKKLPVAKQRGSPTTDTTSSKLTVLKTLFNLPLSASKAGNVIQYWPLLMINKTLQNTKLKILWMAGYLLPASIHEDEISDSYIPLPETCLCRLCPELQGVWKALRPAAALPGRKNRDRWRRWGKNLIGYPSMQLHGGRLYIFISDRNTLHRKRFFWNFFWREHAFANLFIFFSLHIDLKILLPFWMSHSTKSNRPDSLPHHSLRISRSELVQW